MGTQLPATQASTGPQNAGLVNWPGGMLGAVLSVGSGDKRVSHSLNWGQLLDNFLPLTIPVGLIVSLLPLSIFNDIKIS